jgi:hypothetical protein
MKLEISNYDSFSCISKAKYNVGLHYYEDLGLNTRLLLMLLDRFVS